MLIDLSKEQIEYLIECFDFAEDTLDDFEAEIKETLEMALVDQDHFGNDIDV